jgi:hypothetical protein
LLVAKANLISNPLLEEEKTKENEPESDDEPIWEQIPDEEMGRLLL